MNRRRLTIAILISAAALAAVFTAVKLRDNQEFYKTANLLGRFPAEEATVIRADLTLVRAFLSSSKAPLEPEYKAFLDGTGFDYHRDLEFVIAALGSSGNYFIAKGRFDWPKLRAYATQQGGSCYQELCRMPGSTPERRISFLPLRNDTIAIAVSTNDLAVTKLTTPGKPVTTSLPDSPVWISIPGSLLRQPATLPPGLRLLLSALTGADRVIFQVNASPTGIEARLEAPCRSVTDARVLTSQLKTTTAMLKEAVTKDPQTAKDDLAVFLTSGGFDQKDKTVLGRWPVPVGLLQSLTSGI